MKSKFLLIVFIFFCFVVSTYGRVVRHRRMSNKFVFNEHHFIVDDYNTLPALLSPSAKATAILFTRGGLTYDSAVKKFSFDYTIPSKVPFSVVHHVGRNVLCPTPEINTELLKANDGSCTGWLVSPNQMVTAGHCIDERTAADRQLEEQGSPPELYIQKSRCSATQIVFTFQDKATSSTSNTGKLYKDVNKSYSCAGQIGKFVVNDAFRSYTGNTATLTPTPIIDYAILELDRDVDFDGFAYVPVQNTSDNYYSASLANKDVIGVSYPMGFTELYDDTGKVLNFYGKNFKATVDATGGSSGGIVTDRSTGRAIGLVSMGDKRHIWSEENLPSPSTDKCWKRKEIDCETDAADCERFSPVFSAANQFVSLIDARPVSLPSLEKGKSSSTQIKALQYLMGVQEVDVNGEWTNELSTLIKEKVALMKLHVDGVTPVIGSLLPSNYDGKYLTPSVLSMFLCDVEALYDNSANFMGNGEYRESYPRKKPCFGGVASVSSYLPNTYTAGRVAITLLNGHGNRLTIANDLSKDVGGTDPNTPNSVHDTPRDPLRYMSDNLVNALKAFAGSMGYDESHFDENIPLKISLWRHLWNV